MPFLLMVFLTFVCLPEVDAWPEPVWTTAPAWSVAATWLAVALTVLYAYRIARCVRRAPEGDPVARERVLRRYERGRFRHQAGLFAVYLLALLVLGWGWSLDRLWTWDGQTYLPGVELALLAPFVVGQIFGWAMFYDAERAAHQAPPRLLALEPHAAPWLELERPRRGKASSFGSRGSYVLFQVRQKLALVFLPVALLLIQKELRRLFPQAWAGWQEGAVNIAGVGAVLAVFVCMPWIIRLVLGLRPLPAGPLRDRLEASARRLRFRCGDILLWDTRNGMANAMVVGILPWVRYVVFTDRLVEDFTPDEVEAVLGHEVGHIRHHHMLYYFGFLSASVTALACLATLCERWYGLSLDAADHKYLAAVPMLAVLLGYIFVVFGFLSRRCERQADVFGCRAVSCSRPDCAGHDGGVDLPQRGRGLCGTGIRTFIRALEKVARVNGISRDRPGFLQSWQHSTIARRVDFLQRVLSDPRVEARFQRRVALFKWALFLVLCGALVFLTLCVQADDGPAPAASPPATVLREVPNP
jgi:Zn-dependent protease with chaperone function